MQVAFARNVTPVAKELENATDKRIEKISYRSLERFLKRDFNT